METERRAVCRLIQALGRVCRTRLFEEKRLIAPSRRTGQQWLDQLVRNGQPVLNVRVQTWRALVFDLAAPVFLRQGLAPLSETTGVLLVDTLWSTQPPEGESYFTRQQRSLRFSSALWATLRALRLGGVASGDLSAGAFEDPAKAREIAAVLRALEQSLEARRQVDYAAQLRIASDRVRSDPAALPQGTVFLLPRDLDLVGLERVLLDAFPNDQVFWLEVDEPCFAPGAAPVETDCDRLRWIRVPAAVPPPVRDGTVCFFQAAGEANEVREVLRRVLAAGLPLDTVEVLYTDVAVYVRLFYEIGQRLFAGWQPSFPGLFGLPFTFAEGVPTVYSRPGRALTSWVQWVRDGYPQSTFLQMLEDGLFAVPCEPECADAGTTSFALARIFRSLGILHGRDRYLRMLDEALVACAREPEVREDDESDSESAEARRAHRQARRDGLAVLRRLADSILAITPTDSAPPLVVLNAARQFLSTLVRTCNEYDNYAREALVQKIVEMAEGVESVEGVSSLEPWTWLATLPGAVHVGGSGPRPGCLHLASLQSGGHSGRNHLYIIGLDDVRFPGSGAQDPLLLDEERESLSGTLPTARQRVRRRVEAFERLLCRQRGSVTLSYSCLDLRDGREAFPSPLLLAAWRVIASEPEADQQQMTAALGAPASFAPSAEAAALDESEWWLWRLTERGIAVDGWPAMAARFPLLAHGLALERSREEGHLTEFDGFVPLAGTDLDPCRLDGPVLSARQLETMGACPLRYFFRYGLDITPPKEITVDPARWLSPSETGALLHEVFESFMRTLIEEQRPPELPRDSDRLRTLLDAALARYQREIPSPCENAFRTVRRECWEACRTFLAEEIEHSRTHQPVFLEVCVGMAPDDRDDPVRFLLPGGGTIRLRGRIDRIDRLRGTSGPSQFVVWDYKTGRIPEYPKRDPFDEGRHLQPVVYLALARSILRDRVGGEARVVQCGYFYPGRRGNGERRSWHVSVLEEGSAVIDRLCRTVASGVFGASTCTECKDCRYCDYQRICEPVEETVRRSRIKRGLDASAGEPESE